MAPSHHGDVISSFGDLGALLGLDLSGLTTATGGSIPDVVAPAPTGVAATDTASLQAAIDSTPTGGFLLIPGHATDKTQPYVTNAALTISRSMRVEGRSAVGGSYTSPVPTTGIGTIIKQTTAATDVLKVSAAAAISCAIRNLVLTFDAAIKDTNTGHGLNSTPNANVQGLLTSVLENILVFGHDGNHYGFTIRNSCQSDFNRLFSIGGGCFYMEENHSGFNYGNSVITSLFGQVQNSGTANGIHLACTHSLGLNFLHFVRPQINIQGTALNTAQDFFKTSGAGQLWNILVDDPDMETGGAGSNPCSFGGRASGVLVRSPAAVTNATTYDAEKDFVQITTPGANTWVCPPGVRRVRVRVVGGGGGGGGAGSNAAAAVQSGGGGGGAGQVSEGFVSVNPLQSYTVTVGAAGAVGAGGASGGNVGADGGNGGISDFAGNVFANGGGKGKGGAASSSGTVNGGLYGSTGGATTAAANLPGCGGPNAQPSVPLGAVVGGAGGGGSSTTNGGGAGGASTVAWPARAGQSQGGSGTSGTAAGVNGTTATTNGCGGGGGGGAPSGGAGGNGGAGAPGIVEIYW